MRQRYLPRDAQISFSLMGHLQHEALDDPVELAPLVVHRDALGCVALVSLAQVQEVGARLGAGVGVQLERDALDFLVSNLEMRARTLNVPSCREIDKGMGVPKLVVILWPSAGAFKVLYRCHGSCRDDAGMELRACVFFQERKTRPCVVHL